MRTTATPDKSGMHVWAREMGRLTAHTEKAILKATQDFESRVQRLRYRHNKQMAELAAQRKPDHQALKELRSGIAKASADMNEAYRQAISHFWSRSAKNYLRLKANDKKA